MEPDYENIEPQPEFGATIEQFTSYDSKLKILFLSIDPFIEEDAQPNLDTIFGKVCI